MLTGLKKKISTQQNLGDGGSGGKKKRNEKKIFSVPERRSYLKALGSSSEISGVLMICSMLYPFYTGVCHWCP